MSNYNKANSREAKARAEATFKRKEQQSPEALRRGKSTKRSASRSQQIPNV